MIKAKLSVPHLLAIVLLCFSLPSAVFLQSGYLNKRYTVFIPSPDCPWCDQNEVAQRDVIYLPVKAPIMRLFAPADSDFLADMLWMRTCYYFGHHALTDRQYPYLLNLLDLITDLAPKWVDPYLFGGLILPTEANAVDEGMNLIEKGLIHHPENWQLWFFKGYYLWKSYDDYEGAAAAIHRASVSPEAPAYLAHVSATFATKAGKKELAVRFLREALNNMRDPRQRWALERRIEEMLKNE